MNIEECRNYCIGKTGATEGFPFDENTLVFKVMGKMFALTNIKEFESINLKCLPDLAIELREQFYGIKPGFHMSKKHWNTINIHEDVNDIKIKELIDLSYELVVKGLTKKLQAELKLMS